MSLHYLDEYQRLEDIDKFKELFHELWGLNHNLEYDKTKWVEALRLLDNIIKK